MWAAMEVGQYWSKRLSSVVGSSSFPGRPGYFRCHSRRTPSGLTPASLRRGLVVAVPPSKNRSALSHAWMGSDPERTPVEGWNPVRKCLSRMPEQVLWPTGRRAGITLVWANGWARPPERTGYRGGLTCSFAGLGPFNHDVRRHIDSHRSLGGTDQAGLGVNRKRAFVGV